MLFREGGDPLLFQSNSNTFAAELIMATMEPKVIVRKEQAAALGAEEVVKAEGVTRVAGAGGGAGGGGEGEGEGDQRGGGETRDREEGDGVGGGDGMGLGPGRRGPGDDGGGSSQESEATRTPASEDQVRLRACSQGYGTLIANTKTTYWQRRSCCQHERTRNQLSRGTGEVSDRKFPRKIPRISNVHENMVRWSSSTFARPSLIFERMRGGRYPPL